MKTVTIYVTDATAKQIVRLAKTGHTDVPEGAVEILDVPRRAVGRPAGGSDAAYTAYRLLTDHAMPFRRGYAREIKVDGRPYILPDTLFYGRLK